MKKGSAIPERSEHLKFAVLASDVALFTIRDGVLYVRLIKVDRPPYFTNARGLPGGLIDPRETAQETAVRQVELKAKVEQRKVYIEQLYTFSAIQRDPRGRVVAVAYLALVPWEKLSPSEQADSQDAWWSKVADTKKLAYDHDEIVDIALTRLRSRVTYTTLISKLMPKEFTLTDLEHANEAILKSNLDKRNFRKKILKLKILTPLNRKRTLGASRPAELYTFASSTVKDIEVL